MNDHHMIREIREQPEVFGRIVAETGPRIRHIVREDWTGPPPSTYYLAGCGSSYYAGMVGAFYHEYTLGLDARALPSSEFVWFAPRPKAASSILMALSRTGKTSETVEAARKAMKLKIPSMAITSEPASTMGQECDYCVDINTKIEQSTVMTKTFTASALCSILVGAEFAALGGARIPESFATDQSRLRKDAEDVIQTTEDQARAIASKSRGIARFIYLGSGANFGTCLEGALKVRETSQSASETYHPMELRHGPFAELEKGIQVFAIVSRGTAVRQEAQLLKEIAATHATVVPVSDVPEILDSYTDSIRMPHVTSSEFAPLLFAIPLQLFAYYYSVNKGLNPDQPRNLTRYVTTQIGPSS